MRFLPAEPNARSQQIDKCFRGIGSRYAQARTAEVGAQRHLENYAIVIAWRVRPEWEAAARREKRDGDCMQSAHGAMPLRNGDALVARCRACACLRLAAVRRRSAAQRQQCAGNHDHQGQRRDAGAEIRRVPRRHGRRRAGLLRSRQHRERRQGSRLRDDEGRPHRRGRRGDGCDCLESSVRSGQLPHQQWRQRVLHDLFPGDRSQSALRVQLRPRWMRSPVCGRRRSRDHRRGWPQITTLKSYDEKGSGAISLRPRATSPISTSSTPAIPGTTATIRATSPRSISRPGRRPSSTPPAAT